MDIPRLPPVVAVHDARVRHPNRVYILDRKHQRAVGHRDPHSRSLQQEIPGGIFHLFSNIDRVRPRFPVVGTLCQHELSGCFLAIAVHRVRPSSPITHSVCPCCNDPYGTRYIIHENGRIPYSILCFGHSPVLTETKREPHIFPCLSFVRTTAQPYIYVLLQVDAAIISHVINPQQGTLLGSDQSRDPVRGRTVVARVSYAYSQPERLTLIREVERSLLPIQLAGRKINIHGR